MKRELVRSITLTTKVNEAELAAIHRLSGGDPLTSEWLRDFLLERARRGSAEVALMAEVLSLRRFLVNLLDHLVSGLPTTAAVTRSLVEHADKDKREKAQKALEL